MQSERLPPTQDALQQSILRAHHQAIIWNNDTVANPDIPSPENYGWTLEDNRWVPIMTTQLPAPKSIIQLVKCGCAKAKCDTNRCSCRRAGLSYTELCACCEIDEVCTNDKALVCEEESEPEDSDYEDGDGEMKFCFSQNTFFLILTKAVPPAKVGLVITKLLTTSPVVSWRGWETPPPPPAQLSFFA